MNCLKLQVVRAFGTLLGYSPLVAVILLLPQIHLFAAQPVTNSSTELSIPATFVRNVAVPGEGQPLRRPSALHFDSWHDELLVADSAGNRIIIFQSGGSFLYAFSLGGIMTSPRDVVTDPEGIIYVLGAVPGGTRIHRFDFDGLPLGWVPWEAVDTAGAGSLRSLVCDDSGRLFSLDHGQLSIISCRPDGLEERSFSLGEQLGGEKARDLVLGRLTWANGELLVPVSNQGTVLRYSPDGEYLGSIGHQGSVTGTLNFPVAAEVTSTGQVLILDKNRFNVACFSREGRFLGEFGGKGFSPGWFFQPSLLAIPTPDHVVIGQIFQNKIQICKLPSFANPQGRTEGSEQGAKPWRGTTSAEPAAEIGSLSPRRLSGWNSLSSSQREGRPSPQVFAVSELEVSE